VSRTSRLFLLMDALRAHRRPVTAARLADELSVSLRTIYRDIQTLSELGAPIEGEADFVGPVRAPGTITVSPPKRLGERKLDGETVAGSRIEATIPAGAIGNEHPIQMSAEQWYGKDLQVVVEATYKDPRTGETKYKLSDIDRAEPDAKLFKVPDGYSKQPAPASARKHR